MDRMVDAWMGTTTYIMHDVWMGCMDNAWTGAMTDIIHNVQTGCTDDARTGAMTDVTHNVQMDGDFTGFSCRKFTAFFSP